ncbi:hypothetical protein P1X14_12230 [Sphingomonas sp. AOB5]|uniref:hypothetical protein n=1 Tax=Sphingomonas sp. AOB5 TaxID=3034017 RepID=UPI0023F89EC5|nr:hypothetical protein [Sphingomonas sp. AOB5]MDF7776017.1 hypothetical protein [Sphingomonas sp. AOB5]
MFCWFTGMSPEVAAALITVSGAILGAWLLYMSTIAVARKNLFVTTVTTERAKWREELRKATGALYPAVRAALETRTAETLGALDEQRIAIRLRLNPSREEKHKLDIAISDALQALILAVERNDPIEAYTRLELIESNVQQLLKQEWDKSKGEARSGELAP